MMGTETKNTIQLRVAEFTRTPGPRYRTDGKHSGQEFREEWLLPKFRDAQEKGATLIVDLDDTAGYASSFLEESFGGLVREVNSDALSDESSIEMVASTVEVRSDTRPWYLEEVDKHIHEALD